MKKMLSFLGTIGLVVTPITTLISCDNSSYPKPINFTENTSLKELSDVWSVSSLNELPTKELPKQSSSVKEVKTEVSLETFNDSVYNLLAGRCSNWSDAYKILKTYTITYYEDYACKHMIENVSDLQKKDNNTYQKIYFVVNRMDSKKESSNPMVIYPVDKYEMKSNFFSNNEITLVVDYSLFEKGIEKPDSEDINNFIKNVIKLGKSYYKNDNENENIIINSKNLATIFYLDDTNNRLYTLSLENYLTYDSYIRSYISGLLNVGSDNEKWKSKYSNISLEDYNNTTSK